MSGHVPYQGFDGRKIEPFSLVRDRDNKPWIFLDEIKGMPGHCLTCSMFGEMQAVCSTEDFSYGLAVQPQPGKKDRKFIDHVYRFCANPNPSSPGVGDIPCFVLATSGDRYFVSLGAGATPQEVPSSYVSDSPKSLPPNMIFSFEEEIANRQFQSYSARQNKSDLKCLDGSEKLFWEASFMGKRYVAWEVNREGCRLVIEEIDDAPEASQ